MLKLLPWKQIAIGGAVILALLWGWWAISNHYTDVGRAEVQAKWDIEKKKIKEAEDKAIAKRNADNIIEKAKQDSINKTITENYYAIDSLRNELATAKRMRAGTAICGQGSAGTSKASGPERSDVPDSGARLVREDVERDIRALMIQVEESFATGRACQSFIRDNGFAPAEPANPSITIGTR